MGIHFSWHSVTYSELSGSELPKRGAVLPEDFLASGLLGREEGICGFLMIIAQAILKRLVRQPLGEQTLFLRDLRP
jgi:hypothetical protein